MAFVPTTYLRIESRFRRAAMDFQYTVCITNLNSKGFLTEKEFWKKRIVYGLQLMTTVRLGSLLKPYDRALKK